MKPVRHRFATRSLATVIALSSSALGVERFKQNNTTALNLAGSWDTLPTSADVVVWNSTVTGANATALGADLSFDGIKIVNPGGLVTIGTAATNTLTLGASGINMSGATQNLLINSNLSVASNQSWQVAAGRTLQLQTINTNTRLSGSGNISLVNSTGSGTATFDFRPGSSGSTAFTDQFGFFNYTGNWTINSGVTVKTLRNGRNAWGSGTITLNGGTIGQQQNFSGTWTNDITLQSSSSSTIDDFNTSGVRTLKLQGVLSGSGNLTIAETNAGVSYAANGGVVLTNTNTLSGQVTIAANGVLRVGGVAGNDASLNAGNSGTLGTATIVNNGTLTLSRSDAWTFGNTISSGSGAVTIGGVTGTLVGNGGTQVVTVSGTHGYTGATTVGQGRLDLTGSLTSNVTVQAAGKISGTGSTTGSLTTVAGAGIVLAGGGTTGGLSANGVNIGGATTVSFLSNPVAATTYTVFTYGAGGLTGAANLSAAWRGSFVDDSPNQKYTFVTGATASRTWNTTSGTWDNTGANNNWAEGDLKFYDGDSAVFGDIASDSTITLSGTIAPTAVTVQNSANTYTFQTGSISGTASLTKTGAGTLLLNSAHTLSGATTVSGGIVRIGNSLALQNSSVSNQTHGGLGFATGVTAATLGSLAGSGDIPLTNASSAAVTLTVGGNNSSTSYSGQLSGAGALVKSGTGTLTLGASNTYTGSTTVNDGTIVASSNTSLGSGISNSPSQTSAVVNFGSNTLTIGNTTAGNTGSFFYGRLDGTGSLLLRGGSQTVQNTDGTAGSSGNFQLLLTNASTSPTGSFALDTGTSGTDRKDFGYINDTNSVLTLKSLTGHGAIRTDAGGIPASSVTRFITVNQSSGDTVFNGALLSHRSGANAVRAITFEKTGSSALELAGFIGKETTASAAGAAPVNLIANGGTLNITNPFNTTTTNTDAINIGTVTVSSGTLAFSSQALVNNAGTAGASSILMNGGTLRWNSGTSQDLTAGTTSRLTLAAGKTAVFDTNGNNVNFSNALAGGAVNASLVKTGSGSLTLSGANNYTGSTTVSAGTLVINGSVSTGVVTVQSGATLMGSGTIGGATTIEAGATFSPGNSPGLMTIADALTLEGTTVMELGGLTSGTEYDSVSVTGLLTYGGALNIISYNAYNLAQVATYNLFSLAGGSTGTFDSVSVGGLSLVENAGLWSAENGGLTYTFSQASGQLTVIPEPAAALLGGMGMLILLRRRRAA